MSQLPINSVVSYRWQCTDCTVYSVADWDNASLSNESLLDTVSRFVLAALLKHTGLLGQGCGEGR